MPMHFVAAIDVTESKFPMELPQFKNKLAFENFLESVDDLSFWF